MMPISAGEDDTPVIERIILKPLPRFDSRKFDPSRLTGGASRTARRSWESDGALAAARGPCAGLRVAGFGMENQDNPRAHEHAARVHECILRSTPPVRVHTTALPEPDRHDVRLVGRVASVRRRSSDYLTMQARPKRDP